MHENQMSKGLPKVNPMDRVQEEAIALYGLYGPDDSAVDVDDLNQRQYQRYMGFGDSHIINGAFSAGIRYLIKAAYKKPKKMAPYICFLKASIKRLGTIKIFSS